MVYQYPGDIISLTIRQINIHHTAAEWTGKSRDVVSVFCYHDKIVRDGVTLDQIVACAPVKGILDMDRPGKHVSRFFDQAKRKVFVDKQHEEAYRRTIRFSAT